VARAFDDKAGAYVCMEAFRRLSKEKKLAARVVSVATTQEEIGTRGAQVAAQGIDPDVSIAVDVGHATDHPDADNRKFGRFTLSGGPIIARGPNINPLVYDQMVEAAESLGIPYQIGAESRPTGTDARAIQMAGPGVACGLLSIPLALHAHPRRSRRPQRHRAVRPAPRRVRLPREEEAEPCSVSATRGARRRGHAGTVTHGNDE
jgi:endoglucanase